MSKKLERKKDMTTWFETHYFDEFYHSLTSDYFDEVLASGETALLCEHIDETEFDEIKANAKDKATAAKKEADEKKANGEANKMEDGDAAGPH